VAEFEVRIEVPRQGACRFSLRDFRQTGRLPHVVLAARGSRCQVRMWEQGSRVTVAFTDCQDRCSLQSTFGYVWPILADRHSWGCG
jgi:hypothetical protein